MKLDRGKMWKKIKIWKKQLLCVGTGMVLGAAAWILQERDPVIKEGCVVPLRRNAVRNRAAEQAVKCGMSGDFPFHELTVPFLCSRSCPKTAIIFLRLLLL